MKGPGFDPPTRYGIRNGIVKGTMGVPVAELNRQNAQLSLLYAEEATKAFFYFLTDVTAVVWEDYVSRLLAREPFYIYFEGLEPPI